MGPRDIFGFPSDQDAADALSSGPKSDPVDYSWGMDDSDSGDDNCDCDPAIDDNCDCGD